MADPAAPGWLPDPERAGLLRWWNGLGWSDARKPVAGGAVIPVATSTTPGPATAPAAIRPASRPPGRPASPVARPSGATNGVATAGLVLAVVSMFLGFIPVLTLLAFVLSVAGLIRSRTLARLGVPRTGLIRAVVGLLLSVGVAVVWAPALIAFVTGVVSAMNS